MFNIIRTKKAQSMMEFVAFISFVILAFIIFQKYIVRGISGYWKSAGDAIGAEKIYDPHSTMECAFEFQFSNPDGNPPGAWYDVDCFRRNPLGYDCAQACFSPTRSDGPNCVACVNFCQDPLCADIW